MMEYEEDYEDDEIEYYAVRPNKTQIKKDIAALFDLAETISKLAAIQRHELDLPDDIRRSIDQASALPLTGARKRSLKYAAQQLHKIDVETIKEQLARLQNRSVHSVREHHLAEHWRDKLVAHGNDAFTELVDAFPTTDVQQVRHLLRAIKKETDTGSPPKSSRLLYRYLKLLLAEGASEDDDHGQDESD